MPNPVGYLVRSLVGKLVSFPFGPGLHFRLLQKGLLTSPSPVRPCRPRRPLAGSALGGPPWVRLSRCAWGPLRLFSHLFPPLFPFLFCVLFRPTLGSAFGF